MLQFRVLPILKRLSDDISIAGYDGIDIAKNSGAKAHHPLSGHSGNWQDSCGEADRSD